jgi:hypothetical protein
MGARTSSRGLILDHLPGPDVPSISAAETHELIAANGHEISKQAVHSMLHILLEEGLVEHTKLDRSAFWRKTAAGVSWVAPPSKEPPRTLERKPRGPNAARDERRKERAVFAAALERRMRELGLEKADIVRAVWSTRETLQGRAMMGSYLSGKALPDDETLVKIAKVLQTPADELLIPKPRTVEVVQGPVVAEPIKTNDEHFTFKGDGDKVEIELHASFPTEVGFEIAALITRHMGGRS